MVESALDPKVWGVHGKLPLREDKQYTEEELRTLNEGGEPAQTAADTEDSQAKAVSDRKREEFIRSVLMGTLYSEELTVVRGLVARFRVLRISEFDAVYEAARRKIEQLSTYDAVDRNVLLSEWNWRYRLVMQLQSLVAEGKTTYQAPKNMEEWKARLRLDAGALPSEVVAAAWDWFCDQVMKTEALYACLSAKLMKFCSEVRTMEEQLRKEAEKEFF